MKHFYVIPAGATDYGFFIVHQRANRCYCGTSLQVPLCTNGANRLSGESDNDVDSANNDEFFGCLFNQSEQKKDAAVKRIEGFLLAVPAKKISDNSFADAALKKMFVQYKYFFALERCS